MARKPLIAGNWKMYGRAASLAEIDALNAAIGPAGRRLDVLVCPPAAYVQAAAIGTRGKNVLIGAQDCSAVGEDSARTGEVSAAMLADAGARYVIVGHSERRSQHGESDGLVRRKAEVVAAVNGGLLSVDEVCERYGLTVEEFAAWQRAVDRSGMPGLRVTRIQHYKSLYERQQNY